MGGPAKAAGLKERMERELRRECPADMEINVKIGKGGL